MRRFSDHSPRALTAEYQRNYAETCPPGTAAYMQRYGVLARTLDVAFVHGHLYIAPVPLAGPRQPRTTPPRALVWLLSRTHPAFRRRNRAARRALEHRPWRRVAEHWFGGERDQWRRGNGEIELIDPTSLNEPQLAEHLRGCRQLVTAGYLRRPAAGRAVDRPMSGVGHRSDRGHRRTRRSILGPPTSTVSPWMLVTGYDLDSQTWNELGGTGPTTTTTHAETPVDLRPRVAAEDHAELDTLVTDARHAVRLRDDNGAITAAWPMGLLRRAMLAAGRRLFPSDPGLAMEATF